MPRPCIFGCPPATRGMLHVFPNEERFPDQFKAWVELIPENLLPPQKDFHNKRVCDRHFTDQDHNSSNRVNALAVPSLFLPGRAVFDVPTNEVSAKSSQLPMCIEEPQEININMEDSDSSKAPRHITMDHNYCVNRTGCKREISESTTMKDVALDFCKEDNFEMFELSPSTVGKKQKIATANPVALAHVIIWQKFCDPEWQNIKYTDTQKQFQATPGFSALKPNNLLAGQIPRGKENTILENFDLTLGAITNGLIQQRLVFQELLDSLPKEMTKKVGEAFMNADSKFRKTSDSLLQYVCGRRAEVIKHRRELFILKNKTLGRILHEIPPSETHLFEEEALTELVIEQGGIHNFFPDK